MTLEEMYRQIKEYHIKLGYDADNMPIEARMAHFRNMSHGAFMEVAELVDSAPWKEWRSLLDQTHDADNACMEAIDCIFFLVGSLECLQIKPKEFEQMFCRKMQANLERISSGYNNKPSERLTPDQRDALMLEALRDVGVDNWEGYEAAQERYEEIRQELDPTISFKACEYLDFSDTYSAEKHLISVGGCPKAFWMRNVEADLPSMVQFCKLRGRLNEPQACLDAGHAYCDKYNEVTHTLFLTTINTD